jgi:hypothetical protein
MFRCNISFSCDFDAINPMVLKTIILHLNRASIFVDMAIPERCQFTPTCEMLNVHVTGVVIEFP